MNCFVTGASGFIGSNLVHELVARGHRVKALLRPESDLRGLAGLEFERVTGDVSDRELLKREIAGCDWCFHVAASYHLWLRDYPPMYATNVEGTRNVIEAAGRLVASASSIPAPSAASGCRKSVNGDAVPADEFEQVSETQMRNHYKRSKWQAECVAVELARKGLPIIIVNPTAPVGPRDVKPTPTGQIIVDFLNRKMPAYLDTGLNWVHVRDVAVGHILAAEKGAWANATFLATRRATGRCGKHWPRWRKSPACRRRKSRFLIGSRLAAAYVNETIASITGKPPRAPLAGVRMAKYKMWFNPAKAIRELGLPQTPPRQALADAVAWFRANGYVKKMICGRICQFSSSNWQSCSCL